MKDLDYEKRKNERELFILEDNDDRLLLEESYTMDQRVLYAIDDYISLGGWEWKKN